MAPISIQIRNPNSKLRIQNSKFPERERWTPTTYNLTTRAAKMGGERRSTNRSGPSAQPRGRRVSIRRGRGVPAPRKGQRPPRMLGVFLPGPLPPPTSPRTLLTPTRPANYPWWTASALPARRKRPRRHPHARNHQQGARSKEQGAKTRHSALRNPR